MWLHVFSYLKKAPFAFLFKSLGIYILWYLLYELWLHPNEQIDLWVINVTLKTATIILNILGYSTFSGSDRLMGIDGTNGLWMGDNCNCIELCVLFGGFIIAFPGLLVKKILYIPLGILLIFQLNVFRMVLLAIIQKDLSYKWLIFNHTYTFTIIIYLFIFTLWYYWVKKLAHVIKTQ
jgi:exosortase/archaeosortase family protein